MKLKTKIWLSFAAAFTVFVVVLYFGLVGVLDAVSGKLMRKQAEDITMLLEHQIADSASAGGQLDLAAVTAILGQVKHVADQGASFDIAKILLIDQAYRAVAAFPESETGVDYSAHADIREAMLGQTRLVAIEEASTVTGVSRREIDVVSWFQTAAGEAYAVELKLDFARSTMLLEDQYRFIETSAVAIAFVLLAALLLALLVLVSRSAIRPVAEVTKAMQRVGGGDLSVSLDRVGLDEFGLMAVRFNEMVRGLKERSKLSQYVSRSTVAAVQDAVGSGSSSHQVERRHLTMFFSDIRGFTPYSESRDPGQVVTTLNTVLSLQAEIIRQAGGDVDKFIGDEVMAVFPDVLPAVEAAFSIQKAMSARRGEVDGLGLGIGIHDGDVVQGDVGSQDIRNYTVIGDAVNTAARLEAIARPGEILLSESANGAAGVQSHFAVVMRGELKLKGKEIPIRTYSVQGRHRV
ncbi:MAG: hypothetical protein A2087_07895 [Spirochaetes bacterium GWD1_61_31]|nr:MAG: hypothetical protein A2Y37_06135 [Spirochaetes bacterium GWB1_60_80]OHD34983.1 MAG: hypothetical protein A2004_03960 [Spirochaetes bacterium GWC1_61_12]OHD40459.1 MAG: hypothetical protein A2087_07895 [Spirochaetes bacterium GWD1_61_31]OHD43068.1 MAG: hypothetical protein A2Y35_01480 [Spirochaetes bacterium GWE1_60_18]OHD59664.1 MAG: hypothetical protein A2Y32_12355 [Spirochaetes bacterium GWF1_60_12]HAP44109.1 hypothetical protein [Spirochaetaceae bacterium]